MGQPQVPLSNVRILNVLLAVAMGGAVVGFFIGTQGSARPAPLPTARSVEPSEADPGQTYRELRARRFGKNSKVTSELAALATDFPKLADEVPEMTPEGRAEALADRAHRRAFFGAPPVIPHPVDDSSSGSCLACHRTGVKVAGKIAYPISHPPYANCLQCHAPSVGRLGGDPPKLVTDFTRLDESTLASRAWPGAPPRMPHGVWMRENCTSCHGLVARPGLRTPHPNRQNCQQCHVPEGAVPPTFELP
jgi:cytochrome c-type protein NapB